MLNSLTILAPGLLGGSLGMACHKQGLAKRIGVWARRAETREACQKSDWCTDVFETAPEACRASDLVVICTPVEHILPLIKQIAGELRPGTIVTDVGSTKAIISTAAPALLPEGCFFVGSHPMAGSEKSGLGHAVESLFKGNPCFITPLPETPTSAIDAVGALWKGVGMKLLETNPERHDQLVARVSHLPHVIASALTVAVGQSDQPWKEACGQGFRDTTRIAAGHPEMWRDICLQNREALLDVLGDFQETLSQFTEALEEKNFDLLKDLFDEGRRYRRDLTAYDD